MDSRALFALVAIHHLLDRLRVPLLGGSVSSHSVVGDHSSLVVVHLHLLLQGSVHPDASGNLILVEHLAFSI